MAVDYTKGMRPNLYELMQGGGGGSYTLPPATRTTLGGVKIGELMNVTPDGTINPIIALNPATTERAGVVKIGEGIQVTQDGTISVEGESYTLPPATASTLGGVKIGSGVEVAQDGTISVEGESYTLPPATASALGGVKIGEGVEVAQDGTISVPNPVLYRRASINVTPPSSSNVQINNLYYTLVTTLDINDEISHISFDGVLHVNADIPETLFDDASGVGIFTPISLGQLPAAASFLTAPLFDVRKNFIYSSYESPAASSLYSGDVVTFVYGVTIDTNKNFIMIPNNVLSGTGAGYLAGLDLPFEINYTTYTPNT